MICWMCKNARWDDGLKFYEIKCVIDQKIHDENDDCESFELNPNYSRINPRMIQK